jgi:hypothetical protein
MEAKETKKSCLRNEKVIVRKLPKRTLLVKDPNHIMSDGMHTNAVKTFCVPKLQKSNNFVNVLTNEEKDCLEEAMGLPHNALSIYRQPKEDNYWSDANPNGFGRVTLTKHDNIFNLSDPADYARYKILLANKDIICPSMEEWSARPKETYEYVIIREGQETEISKDNTSAIIQAVMKLGKIAENKDTLQLVVETMMGKKFSSNTTKEYLQSQALSMIQNTPKNAKLFLNIIKDDNLDNKVLIRKCISKGIIADRGNHLFIKESNTPMCGDGEDPTINNAAKWLAEPKNQEILFSLQAKVKN